MDLTENDPAYENGIWVLSHELQEFVHFYNGVNTDKKAAAEGSIVLRKRHVKR